MFDHVDIRVADLAASRRFYDTVFAPLGIRPDVLAAQVVTLLKSRGVRPASSRAERRSCSARMISIALSNTARGGPDLPLIQIATWLG